MNFHPDQRRDHARGFTLVELLMVILIMVVLANISLLALKSLGGSTSLTGTSDVVSGVFNSARQEAISKNTLTAVIIDSNVAGSDPLAYKLMSVWEYSTSSSSWVQAFKWRALPTGIVIDMSTVVPSSTSSLAQALTGITYQGNSFTTFVAFVFYPSGRLVPPSSGQCTLQLVEGFYPSSGATKPTYTHAVAGGGAPANYVTYYFSTATGEAKLVRL